MCVQGQGKNLFQHEGVLQLHARLFVDRDEATTNLSTEDLPRDRNRMPHAVFQGLFDDELGQGEASVLGRSSICNLKSDYASTLATRVATSRWELKYHFAA
ncbi:hypothetical protein D9M70_607800 [compost metagenome]